MHVAEQRRTIFASEAVRGAPVWAQVGGVRVHARLGGWHRSGEAVVLVHGLGVSSRYFTPVLRALEPHVRVAAPDLPGFGRSGTPQHALDIPELADSLAAWMAAVGLPCATFVGNSMGCQVIVDLAVRHAGLVRRAVLVGPTLEPAIRAALPAVWRLAVDAFRESPTLLPLAAYDYLLFGPLRLWRTFRHAADDPIEAKLRAVAVPVLLVRGEHDPIAPQAWVESLARHAAEARVMVIPGAAHAAHYTSPGALARLVLCFMKGDSGAGEGAGAA